MNLASGWAVPGSAWVQTPNAAPAAIPAPAAAEADAGYPRAQWQSAALDPTELAISREAKEAIVETCVIWVRNSAPGHLTLKQKSRLLAIALHLAPDHRSAIVADGQLARGVTPKPTPYREPVDLEQRIAKLAPIITLCLTSPAKTASDEVLGQYLVSVLAEMHEHGRRLKDNLAPQLVVNWEEMQRPSRLPKHWIEQELTAPLRSTDVAVSMLLDADQPPHLFTATAKEHPGSVQPMRIDAAEPLVPEVMKCASEVKRLLGQWHGEMPRGWTVQLGDWPQPPSQTTRLTGIADQPTPLALALTVDGLLSGRAYDGQAWVACQWNPVEDKIEDWLYTEQLVSHLREQPPGPGFLVVGPGHEALLLDWLVADPEVFHALWRRPLCEVRQFSDVAGHLQKPLSPKISEARRLFMKVAGQCATERMEVFKNPTLKADLAAILQIHPHNLSARLLQHCAVGILPKQLSPAGSHRQILRIVDPLWHRGLHAEQLNALPWAALKAVADNVDRQLTRIRPRVAPEARFLLDNIVKSINLSRRFAADPPRVPRERNRQQAEWDMLRGEREALFRKAKLDEVQRAVYDRTRAKAAAKSNAGPASTLPTPLNSPTSAQP